MFTVYANPEQLADKVAQYLLELVQQRPQAVLGLATGSTMLPVYAQWIAKIKATHTDVSQLRTFNLDEYVGLGAEHPQSYHYYMQQHLFSQLAFDPKQIHLPDGLCAQVDQQCADYSQAIQHAGGIDLQLLGIGSNGHIGFNEPGTPFSTRTHVVALSEQTRLDNGRFFKDQSQMPTHAITLGLQDILEAKQIMLLITGEHKAQTVLDLYQSAIDPCMPASVLKKHPQTHILVDAAAASLLPKQAIDAA